MLKFNYLNEGNYFDYCEALYTWCILNHEGQFSEQYKIMCQIDFKPGALWSESKVIEENEYFNEISEDNYQDIFKEYQAWFDKDSRECPLCNSEHERHSIEEFCLNYTEFSVSESYVTAIENNDFSGLDEEETELVEDFLARLENGQLLLQDGEPSFYECEVSNSMANCVTYKWYESLKPTTKIYIKE